MSIKAFKDGAGYTTNTVKVIADDEYCDTDIKRVIAFLLSLLAAQSEYTSDPMTPIDDTKRVQDQTRDEWLAEYEEQ